MSERAYLDENGSRSLTSRRGFLTGSATALAGGALMTVPGAVLEDIGVTAYDGPIAYIHWPGLQTAGATIAIVEARHASYLRLLNGEVPFPEPFDDPKAPRQVCEMVDPFIIKSPST
jgi:hypothetical protein